MKKLQQKKNITANFKLSDIQEKYMKYILKTMTKNYFEINIKI